eukprot:4181171-Prymnesium_polylepis.1
MFVATWYKFATFPSNLLLERSQVRASCDQPLALRHIHTRHAAAEVAARCAHPGGALADVRAHAGSRRELAPRGVRQPRRASSHGEPRAENVW